MSVKKRKFSCLTFLAKFDHNKTEEFKGTQLLGNVVLDVLLFTFEIVEEIVRGTTSDLVSYLTMNVDKFRQIKVHPLLSLLINCFAPTYLKLA